MKANNIINKDLILREKLALQRTVLANQSTFLSFLRSSMYFLMAGLSIDHLLEIKEGTIYKIGLFVLSGILFISGIVNYFFQAKRIKDGEKHIGHYKDDYESS